MDAITYALSKKYTDNKIAESAGLHRQIVTSLPTTGDEKIIYMVRVSNDNEDSDNYNEYMWIDGNWELIGNTRVDLSDYYNKTQVDTALNGKANVATTLSGYGITNAYTKSEVDSGLSGKVDKTVLGLLQYHTISNIDRPWDSGVTALTITFYRVSNVSEHSGTMPFGNSSFVLCTSHSSQNYGMQFAFSDNPECFASRSLSSGTWTAWKKIGDSDEQIKIRSLSIDVPAVSAGRDCVVSKALPVVSGYKAVGIIGLSTLGNIKPLTLNDFFVNNTEAYVAFYNHTSSATTSSAVTLDLLYKKT